MPRYYLIGDPQTGTVIKRAHDWPMPSELGIGIRVSKRVWKAYRAGDRIGPTDIDEPHRSRWLKARQSRSVIWHQQRRKGTR